MASTVRFPTYPTYEPLPLDLEDCDEVHGVEVDIDEFNYPIVLCEVSTNGQCEFSLEDDCCIYCGNEVERLAV